MNIFIWWDFTKNKKSKSQEIPEKISATALSPLFRPPKIPYIRGDTRGEGGTPT
jgi:hypothetical protein